jgi:glycosyltransferase involved in cell wall biosynthesis
MDLPLPATLGALTPAAGGRHVLLLDWDLFGRVGGGQSVYRRLIGARPGDTFYYFRRDEHPAAPRPANAVAIPYRDAWRSRTQLAGNTGHLLWQYIACRNLAFSVAEHLGRRDFDVVDTPDYSQFGAFIRPALAAEGIRVGSVALALHGTLSAAFLAGWPSPQSESRILAELRMREHLQFRAADARYAISAAYAEQWRRYAPLPVNALDPLCIVGEPAPVAAPTGGPPDLAFVGRREKWKGPDLFLDIAWCVDRARYGRLLLVGPDGPNRLGNGSDAPLAAMARQRGLAPEILGSMSPEAVTALLRGRTVLLLPSRHDTFNLTALEALGQGCPALVSDQAGVATWLRARLPQLGWLVLDVGCGRGAAGQVGAVLADYDGHRDRLLEALSRARLQPDRDSVARIYDPAPETDVEARQTAIDLATRFELLARLEPPPPAEQIRRAARGLARQVAGPVARATPDVLRRPLRAAVRQAFALRRALPRGDIAATAKEMLRARLRGWAGVSPRSVNQVLRARELGQFQKDLLQLPERSSTDLAAKLKALSDAVPDRLVDRARLFRELARLERKAGRDLVAATYGLRLMRWLGEDRFGDLPWVVNTLEAAGFVHEARAARAMFGTPPEERDARCLDLLRDASARNRTKPDLPLAVLEDPRRADAVPRASVIVSLYNAAEKLPALLDNLALQGLARQGGLEVVLVDSASPKDERAALLAWQASRGDTLPVVYARSARRETIQMAWNRGIRLARAPYLAFLGADEGLHPDALLRLADALDADPGADWAMADSLVTNVDRHGVYDSDVMPYDRRGYRQDLVYLETCYLSWVGGLYRRSIHDRFGWYDESYRAAGDTEFKNRVMPHIRSVHVPGMLGVFNNYPEERTTAHPRAEIEDLRAWYLWRTPAGMDYAFAQRPAEDAAALLRDSLGYRKSYCGHISTDFDLAESLALHLATRRDAPAFAAEAVAAVQEALAALRGIELLPTEVGVGGGAMLHVGREIRAFRGPRAERHARLLGLPGSPFHEVFNDNRYEQHWWSWSGG